MAKVPSTVRKQIEIEVFRELSKRGLLTLDELTRVIVNIFEKYHVEVKVDEDD
jgi:hypothetical protein